MTGNCNSGRKPKYLTLEKFNKFLNNDFFHMKVELRANTIINIFLFGLLITLLVIIVNG